MDTRKPSRMCVDLPWKTRTGTRKVAVFFLSKASRRMETPLQGTTKMSPGHHTLFPYEQSPPCPRIHQRREHGPRCACGVHPFQVEGTPANTHVGCTNLADQHLVVQTNCVYKHMCIYVMLYIYICSQTSLPSSDFPPAAPGNAPCAPRLFPRRSLRRLLPDPLPGDHLPTTR